MPENPNDEIRRQILRYFYDRNANATSRFGKKGSAVKISDAKHELKEQHGLAQKQVMSNLTYLIDRGWVKTLDQEKTVKVKGGTVPSIVTWYEVAAPGIEKIEGESEFQPPDRYAGINITATGTNVITLGDGNVVNAQFADLHAELNTLKEAVAAADSMTEGQKLDISVDIESIKDQLAKPQPNKTIVKTLWDSIQSAVTAAGLIDYATRIAPHITALLTA
jgi:hypothetical protein